MHVAEHVEMAGGIFRHGDVVVAVPSDPTGKLVIDPVRHRGRDATVICRFAS